MGLEDFFGKRNYTSDKGQYMRVFGYTLRKPWVKYVNWDIDLGEKLVQAIRQSVASTYVAEIITNDLCDVDCEVIEYLEKTMKS